MKIAISCDDSNLESNVDQRFGRCKYFAIVDILDKKIKNVTYEENKGAIQGHGAGVKAAEQIGNLNPDAVITGNLGPNSTIILNKLKIKTYHASGNIMQAIDDFNNSKLEIIKEVSESHSGLKTQNLNSTINATKVDRIFFPLLDNNGENSTISGHFGHAPFFGLYNTGSKEFSIIDNSLDHADPTKSPVDQIIDAVNPTMIFAQGIGGRAINLFKQRGIPVKTGPFKIVKDALENIDNLTEQTSDCGHSHHH